MVHYFFRIDSKDTLEAETNQIRLAERQDLGLVLPEEHLQLPRLSHLVPGSSPTRPKVLLLCSGVHSEDHVGGS